MAVVTSFARGAPKAASAWPSERARPTHGDDLERGTQPSQPAPAGGRARLPRVGIAALLRTRPGVRGEHFSLHWRVLPAPPGVLFMAIPKRLLASAVDRNAVRRVAREAWRAAGAGRLPVAVMLRMTALPPARGARHRKALARAELDAAFGAMSGRLARG